MSEDQPILIIDSACEADGDSSQGQLPGDHREIESSPDHFATGNFFTCLIGPGRRVYLLHEDVAASQSGFFRAKARKEWKDRSQEVVLEETREDCFKIFVDWIYRGQLPGKLNADDGEGAWLCIPAFTLADMLLCESLKNAIVDEVIGGYNNDYAFPVEVLQKLDDHGIGETTLGKLILNTLAFHVAQGMLEPDYALCHANYVWSANLLFTLHQCINEKWKLVAFTDRCQYHDHFETGKCEIDKSEAGKKK